MQWICGAKLVLRRSAGLILRCAPVRHGICGIALPALVRALVRCAERWHSTGCTSSSASLNAYQLFKDNLRVLRQGHAPDVRVRNPKPEHANGALPEHVQTQEFYLLAWCAGLLLGSRQDARPLLEMVSEDYFPELYPNAVAQCIFEAAALPNCQPPQVWEKLWLDIQQNIEDFLVALERQSQAPDLAQRTSVALKTMILVTFTKLECYR